MTQDEILGNLCYYDGRNPDCEDDYGDARSKECFCDNCFYGRTKLAEHILSIQEKQS